MIIPSKIDIVIRDSFARTMWADNWANAREKAELPTHTAHCREITQCCPETPEEAKWVATLYLAALAESVSRYGRPENLLLQALKADGKPPEAAAQYADEFGSDLYMEAVGHGVSWADDHAKLPFEVRDLDAGELQYLAEEPQHLSHLIP